MPPEQKKRISYMKLYLYMIALGLMFFGMFAMLYRTYDHPFYGHINLGEYHKVIGIVSFLLSAALMSYTRKRF